MNRPILYIANKNYSSWSLRPWIGMKAKGVPFEKNLQQFEIQPTDRNCSGGPFLFGDFAIADAMFAPVVSRFEVHRSGDSDEVRRYSASMTALDAWQEWISAARDEP